MAKVGPLMNILNRFAVNLKLRIWTKTQPRAQPARNIQTLSFLALKIMLQSFAKLSHLASITRMALAVGVTIQCHPHMREYRQMHVYVQLSYLFHKSFPPQTAGILRTAFHGLCLNLFYMTFFVDFHVSVFFLATCDRLS